MVWAHILHVQVEYSTLVLVRYPIFVYQYQLYTKTPYGPSLMYCCVHAQRLHSNVYIYSPPVSRRQPSSSLNLHPEISIFHHSISVSYQSPFVTSAVASYISRPWYFHPSVVPRRCLSSPVSSSSPPSLFFFPPARCLFSLAVHLDLYPRTGPRLSDTLKWT